MSATPYIDIGTLLIRSPDEFGGRPYVAGTGITVRRIVGWYKLGYEAEEILKEIDHLNLAQVYAALAYFHANQQAVEDDIAEEEAENRRIEAEHFKAATTP
jgi:uncharacterized protein (DUF433 family)